MPGDGTFVEFVDYTLSYVGIGVSSCFHFLVPPDVGAIPVLMDTAPVL